MTIEQTLTEKYGPLLSLAHLAKILDRSPEGLRITLRTSSDWSAKVNSTRIKLGRRIYFRTSEIADLLANG